MKSRVDKITSLNVIVFTEIKKQIPNNLNDTLTNWNCSEIWTKIAKPIYTELEEGLFGAIIE